MASAPSPRLRGPAPRPGLAPSAPPRPPRPSQSSREGLRPPRPGAHPDPGPAQCAPSRGPRTPHRQLPAPVSSPGTVARNGQSPRTRRSRQVPGPGGAGGPFRLAVECRRRGVCPAVRWGSRRPGQRAAWSGLPASPVARAAPLPRPPRASPAPRPACPGRPALLPLRALAPPPLCPGSPGRITRPLTPAAAASASSVCARPPLTQLIFCPPQVR